MRVRWEYYPSMRHSIVPHGYDPTMLIGEGTLIGIYHDGDEAKALVFVDGEDAPREIPARGLRR